MVPLDALFFIYSWHNKVSGKKLIGCKSELFVSAIAVSSGLQSGGAELGGDEKERGSLRIQAPDEDQASLA